MADWYGLPDLQRERTVNRECKALNERKRFEVGDEVIGDEHIHGIIFRTNDVYQPAVAGYACLIREYFVKTEEGQTFLYAGETNLRLIKKGMGDSAPPRPEFLKELEGDLRYRPLVGLRI